jgi:hypothetical protein
MIGLGLVISEGSRIVTLLALIRRYVKWSEGKEETAIWKSEIAFSLTRYSDMSSSEFDLSINSS